ncbi:response regulator transcription factor [Paenibacillus physcomitrellae]|uniref:DNA-binding response regulator n=1 Tax=Paenibacillus physcomitrellae TaxID=1619311 RepID=A0ABQ1G029_9BACL|nr:response regulator transcription factor [Paenibacillus physcomitrellae]GGA34194.1 DNA-binding response regulator [Paenibacillus physcomitrellae]
MKQRAKVMLVEDDLDWSNGLQMYFSKEAGFEIVTCVSSKAACMSALDETPVDVVLMDIMLGDADSSGLDAALDITHKHPSVKVIMLSSLDDDDEVFNEAFLNGAYDFVYKNEFEQIPEVIAGAMKDQQTKYGPRLKKLIYDKKKKLLTPYDVVLLKLIAEGKTQQEIADMNSVSLSAVKKHVGRVLEKFQWDRSTRELADKCMKWGILE